MANECPIKELRRKATCPVCLEFFNQPMLLNCGHNFCQACLVKYWRECGVVSTCPQCLEKSLRNSIVANQQLAKIVEAVKKLQKGEGAEGKCQKLQEKLPKLCGEDDRNICVVCDRFKKNRAHAVLSVEEATQDHKASCNEFGTQSMADLPKLFEHFQQQGLSIGSLSGEDLRILLMQHISQPELESAKVKAKKIQPQQQEHDAKEGCDPKETEAFRVPEKTREEQIPAQAQPLKPVFESLQQRRKELENVHRTFSPKQNLFPQRAAQIVRGPRAEAHVDYPAPVLWGEFEKERVPYICKAAVSEEFFTLQAQEGRSFSEFVAQLQKALNKWLDDVEAESREEVLNAILLERLFSQLPPGIRSVVKARDLPTVSCAAAMADDLMRGYKRQGSLFP